MTPRQGAGALPIALLLSLLLGCGGGGGGGGVMTRLHCDGAVTPLADRVVLGCPADGVDSLTIAVRLGGPTTSTDIYGFKFDLVFDPAVVQFEPPALEGAFLSQGGASTILEIDAAEGDPGRLVVAISRQGEAAGVQGTAADQVVMTLLFRGVAAGSTTLAFENADVVDSTLMPLPEIEFGAPLTLTFE